MRGHGKQVATAAMLAMVMGGALSACSGDAEKKPGAGGTGQASAKASMDPASVTSCEQMGEQLPAELASRYPGIKAVVNQAETAKPAAGAATGKDALRCTLKVTLTDTANDKELGSYRFTRTLAEKNVIDESQGKSSLESVLYVKRSTYFGTAQSAIATSVLEVKDKNALPENFAGLGVDLDKQLTVGYYKVTKKGVNICLADASTNARGLLKVAKNGTSSMTGPTLGDCKQAAQEFKKLP